MNVALEKRRLGGWILQKSRSALARNTTWMMIAQGGGLAIQAVYFIVIARVLGVAGLGVFGGALALVSLAAPFAGWGSASVLVKQVARDPSRFPAYWGNALLTASLSGILFTILAASLSAIFFPGIPTRLIVLLASAELVCAAILESCAKGFMAFERLDGTAQLNLLLSASRLIAAVIFALVAKPTPLLWGFCYFVASAAAMAVALIYTMVRLGRPRPRPSLIPGALGEGWYFALSLSAQTIYNDIDKTMLTYLSSFEAVGIYTTAYRILRVAFAPISSILSSTYSAFFRHGAHGIRGSLAFARRLLPFSVGYGLLASTGLLLLAPVIPHLLGEQFRPSVEALRWLSLIPLFQCLHYFAADTLTGADAQRLRSIIQVGVAVFNILINLWLIPAYSWRGAAWSSLASDGALALGLWIAVFILHNRNVTAPSVEETSARAWPILANERDG